MDEAGTYHGKPTPEAALAEFVETVEATGGVFETRKGLLAPVGDPDWVDLASAYETACAALGREPMVVARPDWADLDGEEE